jgi:hypothetical protein
MLRVVLKTIESLAKSAQIAADVGQHGARCRCWIVAGSRTTTSRRSWVLGDATDASSFK